MGQAVVHFEVIGKDGERLQGFYSDMFGWEINADNPMNYGLVAREGNSNADGVGIGGGIGSGPDGQSYATFYVEVDDVEAGLQKAESLGGSRVMGPDGRHGPGDDRPLQRPRGPHDRAGQDPGGVGIACCGAAA